MEEFKEERKFKIFERIAPYLEREEQKKDLKWSIDGIKQSYDSKISDLKKDHDSQIEHYQKLQKQNSTFTDAKKKEI